MKTKLAILLAASLLLSTYAVGVRADEMMAAPAADTPASDASAAQIDPQVTKYMHKVSDFYGGMKSMSMTMKADMHVETQDNKKEMQSVYKVEVQKPSRISFTMESGRLGGIAKSDGENFYLYSPQLGMYIKSQAPSDLSQVFAKPEFAFVSGGFSGLSLLEALIAPDPYAVIMQGVTGANLIGKEKIDGVETQHFHFIQKELSWDLWVDAGDKPWIRRVAPDVSAILSHYQGPGKDMKMILNINYADMASNPEIAKADFNFSPPGDAKEVTSFFKSGDSEEGENPLAKKPAPSIKLDTLDGGKFDLAALKDKNVVVLDFWATWCPPCRRALPILSEVTKTYQPKGVQFFAVDEMEDPAKVQEYLKAQGLDINVALDRAGAAGQAYHVTGIPQTVIVGKDGVVHSIHVGFAPDLKERLTGELDAILAGKEPATETK